MKATKEYAEILRYEIRMERDKDEEMYRRCMWAHFYLDLDSGTLLANTDAGDAVHRWPERGADFLRLMATADSDYLMEKLFQRETFNCDASVRDTIERLREWNEEQDEKHQIRETDLQECIKSLEEIECSTLEHYYWTACEILQIYGIMDTSLIDDQLEYSPHQRTFTKVFTEYLQPLLRQELKRRYRNAV